MYFTRYEKELLENSYQYNKIPLYIFSESGELLYSNLDQNSPLLDLQPVISSLISFPSQNDRDIPAPSFFLNNNYTFELYAYFIYRHDNIPYYVAGGPVLPKHSVLQEDYEALSFYAFLSTEEIEHILNLAPRNTMKEFIAAMKLTMLLLTKKSGDGADPVFFNKTRQNRQFIPQSTADSLSRLVFDACENQKVHMNYKDEMVLWNCIKEGNLAKLDTLPADLFEPGLQNSSSNPLKQILYMGISFTSLATRFAIEGGLNNEVAYCLNDLYIHSLDNCRHISECQLIIKQMLTDFTSHVAKARQSPAQEYSQPVTACIDFIHLHRHEKISLEVLAEQVHLAPKYLSNVFRKETGSTISEFTQAQRIKEAKNLLIYSDYSCAEISSYLCFNTQSYFISIFHKIAGCTPKEYRQKYGKNYWSIN